MSANESRPAEHQGGSQVGGPARSVSRVGGCQVVDLRRFVDDGKWLDLGLKCPTLYVPEGSNVRLLIGDAIGQTGVERLAQNLTNTRVQIEGSNAYGISAVRAALEHHLRAAS